MSGGGPSQRVSPSRVSLQPMPNPPVPEIRNATANESFFRRALYAAIPSWRPTEKNVIAIKDFITDNVPSRDYITGRNAKNLDDLVVSLGLNFRNATLQSYAQFWLDVLRDRAASIQYENGGILYRKIKFVPDYLVPWKVVQELYEKTTLTWDDLGTWYFPGRIETIDFGDKATTLDKIEIPSSTRVLRIRNSLLTDINFWDEKNYGIGLQVVDMSNSRWLSSFRARMKYLRILDLSNTQLVKLPNVDDTPVLEELNISNTHILNVPNYPNLVKLEARNAKLTTIEINESLEYLDAHGNMISHLNLPNKSNLRHCDLSNNVLQNVAGILPMSAVYIDLSNNRLTQVPKMPRGMIIYHLNLSNNASTLIPLETVHHDVISIREPQTARLDEAARFIELRSRAVERRPTTIDRGKNDRPVGNEFNERRERIQKLVKSTAGQRMDPRTGDNKKGENQQKEDKNKQRDTSADKTKHVQFKNKNRGRKRSQDQRSA